MPSDGSLKTSCHDEYVYYDEIASYNISDFDYKRYPFDEQSFKFVVYSKVFEKVSNALEVTFFAKSS